MGALHTPLEFSNHAPIVFLLDLASISSLSFLLQPLCASQKLGMVVGCGVLLWVMFL